MGNVTIKNLHNPKPAESIFGGGAGILTPYKPDSRKTSTANSTSPAKPGRPEPASGSAPEKKTSTLAEASKDGPGAGGSQADAMPADPAQVAQAEMEKASRR